MSLQAGEERRIARSPRRFYIHAGFPASSGLTYFNRDDAASRSWSKRGKGPAGGQQVAGDPRGAGQVVGATFDDD